ncbi:hypothetical protein BDB00DRAFT_182067 [Zychaea mexicana]|uniref:uncharacterized protein n=1 Tax=Zychaea mexicana TaxID=64656 RepID=UPI0022FEBDC9|nr:uncharacterized protein BDB00DRAFT_182067 [Zychaea mexicana]KAI9496034.1 hypothetical protein BDB00DRAFT_182067 [Zychaea mexicana]
MVTTVQRKKSSKPQQQQQQQQQQKEKQPLQQKPQHIPKRSESPSQGSGPNSPANSTSDLSARLAAVMADRNSTKSMSRTSSLSSVSGRQERTSTDGAVGSPKVGEAKAEKKEEIQETTQAGEEPEKVEESETTSLIEDKEGAMKVNSESESEATKSDGDNVDDTKSTEETSPIETTSIVPVASPDPTQQPESNENEDKNKDDTIKKDGEFGDTVDLSTTPLAPPTDTEEISATTDDPEKTVEGLSSSTEKSKSQDTILQQREEQLFQAMQNIAKLHDQIHTLQEEAEKQSAERKSTQTHLEELEKQLKATNRSSVGADQKNVKKLESTIEDLRQQLATKSEQAQALMEEGEKLSKTELKHMTAIKKLRAEKQEQEKNAAELQKKIDRTASDLIEANGKIMKANELEKRLQEKVKVLLDMTERQTKHINKLEIELRSLREQKNQAEMALKDAMENLEAERDKIHAKSKEAHAAMLEKEVKAGEKLREELTSVREGAEAKETRLHEEIRELQAALQSSQNTSGEREDTLRNEVSELQQRIRELESSTEDIDSTVAEATASLLEQIESLQKQHSVAIKNRDQNEQG